MAAARAAAGPAKGRPAPAAPARRYAPSQTTRGVQRTTIVDRRKKPGRRKKPAQPYSGPLYDPTVQLSGKGLAGASRDLVNLEFRPQENALGRELANTTTQGNALVQRAGDYRQQLAENDKTLVPQVAAIGQLLGSSLGTNQSNALAAISGGLDDSHSRTAADQAVRLGVGSSIATAGADTKAQEARGIVAQQGQQSADAAAGQTAAFQQLANLAAQSREVGGREQQQELLTRLANQQADVRARQADLAGQRGAAQSKALTDLRQQAFENLVTQEGLNIKREDIAADTQLGQQKLREDRRQAQADRRLKRRIARASRVATRDANAAKTTAKANEVNKYGITNAQWLKMTPGQRLNSIRDYTDATTRAKAGNGKMSPAAIKDRGTIDSMLTDAQTDPKLKKLVGVPGPELTRRFIKRGGDPLLAQAAAEIAKHGVLTYQTRQALQRRGIRVPRSWRSRPAPVQPNPDQR